MPIESCVPFAVFESSYVARESKPGSFLFIAVALSNCIRFSYIALYVLSLSKEQVANTISKPSAAASGNCAARGTAFQTQWGGS